MLYVCVRNVMDVMFFCLYCEGAELYVLVYGKCEFQRLTPARGGTTRRKIIPLANWSQLIHPRPASSRSSLFMESCAATLTYYSTEPLLLQILASDVHPEHGTDKVPLLGLFKNVTSQVTRYLCTRCSHGYIQEVLVFRGIVDYRRANGWICTTCRPPPQLRAPSPSP